MVGRSVEEDEPFGIVLRDDDEGAARSAARPGSRRCSSASTTAGMNIVVSGEAPFKVLDRFEAPEYPAGEVELIGEDDGAADRRGRGERRARGLRRARRAGDRRAARAEELDGASAYAIAARVELPADTKQRLLELRDEDERMELLANALGAVERALERAEEAAERASGNGKVHFE